MKLYRKGLSQVSSMLVWRLHNSVPLVCDLNMGVLLLVQSHWKMRKALSLCNNLVSVLLYSTFTKEHTLKAALARLASFDGTKG